MSSTPSSPPPMAPMSSMPPMPSMPALPASLRARVLASAASAPAPTVSEGRTRLVGLLAAGVLCVTAFALTHGRRGDWIALPAWASWLPLANATLGAIALTALALSRGRTLLGAPVAWIFAAMIAVPALSGGVAIATSQGAGAPMVPFVQALRSAVACEAIAVALGVLLIALLVASLRGRVLPAPMLLGAAAGVGASVWAQALLSWECHFRDPWHILLGHVLPAVPLALIGAWIGASYARWSRW